MRMTGFDAISFAEREGLTLNKHSDDIDEAVTGLTVAEAEAIASEDPELIWLEVSGRNKFIRKWDGHSCPSGEDGQECPSYG